MRPLRHFATCGQPIEESSKDGKGHFLLDTVRVASITRQSRLLMALPENRILPPKWNAAVVTRGTASLIHQALVFLEDCWILPRVFEAT